MRLDWRGDEVKAKVAAATMLAVDKTMSACVDDAKANHPGYPPASKPYEPYANRTATAVGSIRISDFASANGFIISGEWGSADVNYALFLEIGTSTSGPTAEERAAGGLLNAIPPPIGPLMAPRPVLRPAADREYPLLGARIRAALAGTHLP